MKAARWHRRRDVRVEDVPVPTPGRGEILLRVRLCGICGTDLEEYRHGPLVIPTGRPHPLTGRQAPLTMGHEFHGVVEALGPDVSGFREGDRWRRTSASSATRACSAGGISTPSARSG